MDDLDFEWDPAKAEANEQKHGITFEVAKTVFGDPYARTRPDPLHSADEERWITLGFSDDARLLVVVHTDRDDMVRIISARPATGREWRTYAD